MEMADFWITEKQYIHKLFKVLVPRFQNCPVSYTRMYKAPKSYPDITFRDRAVLELRGNPFPVLKPQLGVNRNFIHNVLLEEAKKEYRKKKYAELSKETEIEASKAGAVDEVSEQLNEIALDESDPAKSKQPTDNSDQKK